MIPSQRIRTKLWNWINEKGVSIVHDRMREESGTVNEQQRFLGTAEPKQEEDQTQVLKKYGVRSEDQIHCSVALVKTDSSR